MLPRARTGRPTPARVAAGIGFLALGLVLSVALPGRSRQPGRDADPATGLAPRPRAADELLAAVAAERMLDGQVERVATALAPPPEPVKGAPTAREFLAQHYGERWPAVERDMEQAGAALDVPYVFTPWEDVAAEFELNFHLSEDEQRAMTERKLAWPETLSVEWIREAYPLAHSAPTDEDLPRIEEQVAGMNDQLRTLSDQWTLLVDYHLQERWLSGGALVAPYTTMGLSHDVGFYSKSVGGHGWAATITLKREDFPDVVALEAELYGLRARRDETVVRYLRGTIAR